MTSRAVVVGIDEYEAGDGWALTGPVDDAVRFAQFFVEQGVEVTLLASPRPDGVDCRAADRATIRQVFMRELPERDGPLYVVWGGHGYVDTERHRRLYYADATVDDPIDLDLDSLLARYASDLVPGPRRQVWIADVCQMHAGDGPLRVTGHETFSAGRAADGRTQDVFFAAGIGQPARNLRLQRTGLFSREMLKLLRAGGLDVLAQPATVIGDLRDRFTELRASGLTRQTPTYLWHQNLLGEGGQVMVGDRRPTESRRVVARPAELAPVVNALLDIPEFARPNDREEVLSLLRGSVYGAIPRSTKARLDTISIVQTCLRYPGALAELLESVRLFAPDAASVQSLEEAIATLDALGSS